MNDSVKDPYVQNKKALSLRIRRSFVDPSYIRDKQQNLTQLIYRRNKLQNGSVLSTSKKSFKEPVTRLRVDHVIKGNSLTPHLPKSHLNTHFFFDTKVDGTNRSRFLPVPNMI